MVEQQIELWNRASIHILDVRHVVVDTVQAEYSYKFPASAYVVVMRGKGDARLLHNKYTLRPLQVFHGAKGATLTIRIEEPLELGLILYRAWLTLSDHYRRFRVPDLENPFRLSYALIPRYPLDTYSKVRTMLEEWQAGTPLARFHVKSMFLSLVHEWMAQLQQQPHDTLEPNLVEQAIRYMCDHIQEPISLDQLANRLSCSSRHLAKRFQQQLQASPIQVLTRIRLTKAVQYLCDTEVSLQEIATRIGYVHAFTLHKVFKKHIGLSPGLFRQRWLEGKPLPKWPIVRSDSDIVEHFSSPYNDNDYQNHFMERKRETYLNKNATLSVSTLLLCLALLTGACAGSGPSNAGDASPAVSSLAASTEGATRIVSTINGEIEIPVKPERIIGVPIEYRELLHALGVKPVAAQNNNEDFPSYLAADFQDVIKLGGGIELPFEVMLSANPDLIVASSWAARESFDSLNKIAPTVVLEDTDWRSTLPMMAEVLNKQEEADRVLAEYDAAVSAARQRLQEIVGSQTVMMLQVKGKDYQVIGMKNGRAQILYHELGLQPPNGDLQEESQLVVSMEKIPEFDPDYILLQLFDEEEESRKAFDELMNHPVFQNMKAFKNNHVFPVGLDNGGREWHLFSFSPQANLHGIQEIVAAFENSNK
ncbi:ABC transporter substrate-binding protein [Cohnella hongkongensis]|uniref:ABC transporter substrate-binding protein n=1 Tax=Cohnella hongkongensis TaxID=178337 RepID=A0ABV9FFR2_9BACL